MMYGLVLTLHVLVSFLLITVILVQGGRGGMADAFGGSGAQSLFGGGANVVMTKITAAGAGIFLVTCLTLAVLSAQRGRSVMEQVPIPLPGVSEPATALPAPTDSPAVADTDATTANPAPPETAVPSP